MRFALTAPLLTLLAACSTAGSPPPDASPAEGPAEAAEAEAPAPGEAADDSLLRLVWVDVPFDDVEVFEAAVAGVVEDAEEAELGADRGWLFLEVERSWREGAEYLVVGRPAATAWIAEPGEGARPSEAALPLADIDVEASSQLIRRTSGSPPTPADEFFLGEATIAAEDAEEAAELGRRFHEVVAKCFATLGFYEGEDDQTFVLLAGVSDTGDVDECFEGLSPEAGQEIYRVGMELEALSSGEGRETELALLPELSHPRHAPSTEELARRGARAERRTLDVMKVDLRNLMSIEELHYAENEYRYTADLAALEEETGWRPSDDVTIRISVTESGDGYSAVAEHPGTAQICSVSMGDAEPPPATAPGEIVCGEPE